MHLHLIHLQGLLLRAPLLQGRRLLQTARLALLLLRLCIAKLLPAVICRALQPSISTGKSMTLLRQPLIDKNKSLRGSGFQ